MHLVVHAERQHADEAERAQPGGVLGRGITVSVAPSSISAALMRQPPTPFIVAAWAKIMRRIGVSHRPGAGDDEAHAAVDRLALQLGAQRDGVHVDQVLAQRLDVDLRPVGLWIGVEDGDDSPGLRPAKALWPPWVGVIGAPSPISIMAW